MMIVMVARGLYREGGIEVAKQPMGARGWRSQVKDGSDLFTKGTGDFFFTTFNFLFFLRSYLFTLFDS